MGNLEYSQIRKQIYGFSSFTPSPRGAKKISNGAFGYLIKIYRHSPPSLELQWAKHTSGTYYL